MKLFFFRYSSVAFCIVALISCSTASKLKKVESTSIELNAQAADDREFEELIAPFKNKMDSIMNDVLVVSEQPLTKGLPEGNLGDFVTDALLKKTNDFYKPADKAPVNIYLLNNGGLRTALPKGNITRGNAFELMPFENAIVVLTLSGEKTKQMFEFIVESNGLPFAGARVKAKEKKIVELKISGKEINTNATYKVATSDYIAGEVSKYFFFKDAIKTEVLKYTLRDAIIDYMVEENKKGHALKATIDGRIKYE
jgi:2',3'-cyclic-nucleotide 2'-phosphodiesterase (5'-nucleotidase family)